MGGPQTDLWRDQAVGEREAHGHTVGTEASDLECESTRFDGQRHFCRERRLT